MDLNRSIALLNFRGLDHGYLLPHINLVGIEATRERIARENLFRHWMRKTEGDQGEALPEENSEEIFNTRIRPFNNSVSTTSTRPNRDPFALDKDYYQFSEFFKDLNPQNDAEDNNGETTPLLNSSGLSQEDLVNITNFLRNLYPEKNDENSAWNGALSEEEVKELGERMEKLFSPPPPSDTSEPSGGPSEP